MNNKGSDRRAFRRVPFKTAMRVRIWKSGPTERRMESENLSEHGAFFSTAEPVTIGSAVEILLKMPEEITGKPATEWRCTGHVVRLQPLDSPVGSTGVGVEFDCHEILRSKEYFPPEAA